MLSQRPGSVVGKVPLPSALRHPEMLGRGPSAGRFLHALVPIFFPFQMTSGGNVVGGLLTRFLLRANPCRASFHKNSFRGLWGCSLRWPLSRTHRTGESRLASSSRFSQCPLCVSAACSQLGGGAVCCCESLGKAEKGETFQRHRWELGTLTLVPLKIFPEGLSIWLWGISSCINSRVRILHLNLQCEGSAQLG